MSSPTRTQVHAQAQAMRAVLDTMLPGVSAGLQEDPIAVLQGRSELAVKLVGELESNDGCSVSGAYRPAMNSQLPAIAVGSSFSRGRRAFTALHELGHHIQQNDIDLVSALCAPGVDSHALEEGACDEFAAGLLLPDDVVAAHICSAGPTADDVASLARASTASRSAVCVRASQLLPSPGHVVLLNADGTVFFAASSGELPLRRGRPQTHSFVRKALAAATHQTQGTVRWTYRDGIEGAEMYAQSADVGNLIVMVSVLDHAPWESFSPPSREDGARARSRICVRCHDDTWSYEAPCARCGAAPCTSCGACECESAVQERVCDHCHLSYPPHMYKGASSVCSDCS